MDKNPLWNVFLNIVACRSFVSQRWAASPVFMYTFILFFWLVYPLRCVVVLFLLVLECMYVCMYVCMYGCMYVCKYFNYRRADTCRM